MLPRPFRLVQSFHSFLRACCPRGGPQPSSASVDDDDAPPMTRRPFAASCERGSRGRGMVSAWLSLRVAAVLVPRRPRREPVNCFSRRARISHPPTASRRPRALTSSSRTLVAARRIERYPRTRLDGFRRSSMSRSSPRAGLTVSRGFSPLAPLLLPFDLLRRRPAAHAQPPTNRRG